MIYRVRWRQYSLLAILLSACSSVSATGGTGPAGMMGSFLSQELRNAGRALGRDRQEGPAAALGTGPKSNMSTLSNVQVGAFNAAVRNGPISAANALNTQRTALNNTATMQGSVFGGNIAPGVLNVAFTPPAATADSMNAQGTASNNLLTTQGTTLDSTAAIQGSVFGGNTPPGALNVAFTPPAATADSMNAQGTASNNLLTAQGTALDSTATMQGSVFGGTAASGAINAAFTQPAAATTSANVQGYGI